MREMNDKVGTRSGEEGLGKLRAGLMPLWAGGGIGVPPLAVRLQGPGTTKEGPRKGHVVGRPVPLPLCFLLCRREWKTRQAGFQKSPRRLGGPAWSPREAKWSPGTKPLQASGLHQCPSWPRAQLPHGASPWLPSCLGRGPSLGSLAPCRLESDTVSSVRYPGPSLLSPPLVIKHRNSPLLGFPESLPSVPTALQAWALQCSAKARP